MAFRCTDCNTIYQKDEERRIWENIGCPRCGNDTFADVPVVKVVP